jgi:hypothetical protein
LVCGTYRGKVAVNVMKKVEKKAKQLEKTTKKTEKAEK